MNYCTLCFIAYFVKYRNIVRFCRGSYKVEALSLHEIATFAVRIFFFFFFYFRATSTIQLDLPADVFRLEEHDRTQLISIYMCMYIFRLNNMTVVSRHPSDVLNIVSTPTILYNPQSLVLITLNCSLFKSMQSFPKS